MSLRLMSEAELRHVEAGRVVQLEWERDRLCVDRDEAEADGDSQRAREIQLVINDLVRELASAGRGRDMDLHKHVDEIGKRALEEFEHQNFPEVSYTQLKWLQEHVVAKILASINAGALPKYRTAGGPERMPEASSDVTLAWTGGTLRLYITYYDALGRSHRRTYRRKILQA